ncbi:UNVERIFIED_CONTAM: Ubiquitin carboxyl-terminal hydrolase 10 [Sesamum calycinum]|uniref:Ubiquitin carboxyl-terminal hydrolase 10 n=1 Tax=Sesamum calycinum TaxID=2727403 RepID=A0AAW2QY25_9LAMI
MTIPDSSSYHYMMENGSSELPCKPEEEKRIVQELTDKAEANLRDGNLYYVVSSRWFMAWQRYTGKIEDGYQFEGHSIESQSARPSNVEGRPGPIDNNDIVVNGAENKDGGPQLLRTLEEGRDYVLVPQEVWEKLLKWYKGGPVLPRKMISVGDQQKQFIVEASVYDLYEKVCLLKGLETEKACIWDYFNKQKHTILISSNQTLEESNLQMDQDILLEVAIDGSQKCLTGNSLALVQVEPIKSTSSIAGDPSMSKGHSTYQNMDDGYESLKPVTGGIMEGELALAFGDLLRKLWSSGQTPVAPRAFKGNLPGLLLSLELLAFLLDGLHEDLNRVKQKPYIETKDYDGRPDEEVADEFWRYHKARNDSIIVDICQLFLSIAGVFNPEISFYLTNFSSNSALFIHYMTHVTLPKQGCCKDLNQALGVACCLQDDEYILLAEVYEHRIYRYLEIPSEPLATIKDDEHIVAYRLPKTEAKLTRLEIWHRYQENEQKLFLTPLVTVLEDPKSGSDVDLAVNKLLSPLRRKAFFTSTATNSCNENVPPSSATEEKTNGCSSQFGPATQSTDGIEPEGMSSKELSFRLCITDAKGYGCQPIVKDSPIQPSRLIKVMLEWTEKEHALYDASYLKDLPEVHKSGLLAKKTKQDAISLFSCLDAFLKDEPLGPDDMWYCPRCKEHRQASKKLDLWRLPDVLVFHLKRFSYSRWLKNKLDTLVNFPIHNLDLSKYLIDENRWYHFDDSHVSPVNESEIKTSAAYVLFYQRVKHTSGGTVTEPSERDITS